MILEDWLERAAPGWHACLVLDPFPIRPGTATLPRAIKNGGLNSFISEGLLHWFYLRHAVVGVSQQAGKRGLMKSEIAITGRRIVISKHASGVICAYDARHRILKVPVEGGVIAELVQERTNSSTLYGAYRNQLLAIVNGSDASLIEF